jgi:hypothetical protein
VLTSVVAHGARERDIAESGDFYNFVENASEQAGAFLATPSPFVLLTRGKLYTKWVSTYWRLRSSLTFRVRIGTPPLTDNFTLAGVNYLSLVSLRNFPFYQKEQFLLLFSPRHYLIAFSMATRRTGVLGLSWLIPCLTNSRRSSRLGMAKGSPSPD